MGRDRHQVWRALRLLGLTALLFVAARLVAHPLAPQDGAADALRLGKAIVLGMLLASGDTLLAAGAILCGGFAGVLAVNLWIGSGAAHIATCLLNVGGTGLAGCLAFGACGRARAALDSIAGVTRLVVMAGVASLVPAALDGLRAGDGLWAGAALEGYAATLLSLLVVTPAVVIVGSREDPDVVRTARHPGLGEIALILAPVSGLAAAAFSRSALPLTFLVGPAVLFAAFRLRALGAVAAVGVVAAISIYATSHGFGPIAQAPGSAADHALLLQLFLACCFLGALPVAATLAERDRSAAAAHAMAERFRAVVENVAEVIFQVDRAGAWTYLNPAWVTLTGRPTQDALGRPLLEAVSEADRADVAARIAPLLAGEVDAVTLAARFDTAAGPHWVEVLLHTLGEGVDAPIAGTLRDVDAAHQREELSRLARHQAEQRAEEAAQLACTDELTGIPNRRAFLRQLDREIAAAVELGWPLSVAMLDVDHFKRVNDTHGHAVGDRVLQLVAERAASVVRGGDLIGRLGGEEFGVLMPGATAADAAMVAERLRQAMQAPSPAGSGLPTVTVSIGLAERVERRTGDRLLAVADEALYRAKQEGRNQVRIAA